MLKVLNMLLFFLICYNNATSGIIDVKKLTNYLSSSSAGTEFLISFPPVYEKIIGGDNSIRIFITSRIRQEVTVEVKGKGVKLTKITVPNDVIEFRISPVDGFPYSKPVTSMAPPEKIYVQSAISIKSKEPIIVFGMARFQYNSDGFLAIPVSSFGTEYVIAAYPQHRAGSIYDLPSVSNIIAAYDDTEVTFTMGGTNGSRTTGGLEKGKKATVTMMKGDVWCFADAGDAQDISGSLIQSNKPVGVVSGNQCASVPSSVYDCSVINEMELPTFTWGKEYHVTPIVGRQKAPVIRVFAKEKDTKVTCDGKEWIRLTLNSRGEGDAFIERRAFDGDVNSLVNGGGTPCKVIAADKPIYVMLYNPGQTVDDYSFSNPFQMVLTPLEQYKNEIEFVTPNGYSDTLTYTRQYVNLIYENTPDGAVPDDLEFAIAVNGRFTWKRVNQQFGTHPGFNFAVPIRGKNYSMKRIQLYGNVIGAFRIRSSSPIAAYIYGFGTFDSFGFPAAVSLGDIDNEISILTIPKKIICQGETFTVNYNSKGLFTPANVFIVELSDSTGSFLNKQVIGTVASDKSGSILCQLPNNVPSGKNYKLRIISTNPQCVSLEDTSSFYIRTRPEPSIQGSQTSCIDTIPVTYRTHYQSGQSYGWSKPRLGTIIGAINLDSVQIEWNASGQDTLILREFTIATGCFKDTSLVITINPRPQPSITGKSQVIENEQGIAYSVTSDPGSTYEWIILSGDAEITKKSGHIIELNVGDPGTVIVKVIQTTAEGCKNETQQEIVVKSITGVKEEMGKSFSVYPNPNNGQEELVVELPSTSLHELRIELIDLLGITRYEGIIPSQTSRHVIQLTDMTKGMYTIRLIMRDGVLSEKVIVE